ncbi:MAG: A/G-specific adenine glycosylase [Verrucomicrobia bacterium]|nr:A/G-specific adenine glycosylase [Verrucomicrobiota bacterium]
MVSSLLRWFKKNARDLPWRRTRDPYAIWISEIMLQQTQVKTVIPYWERWMRELPDATALAAAPEQRVLKLWEGLGYYTRARNLQKAARSIVEQFNGEFPRDFDAVLALPGVGRYTAGAIYSIAFNQPAPILDGNVIRVLTRLHAIHQNPREKQVNERLWQLAASLVATAAAIPNSEFRIPNSITGNCSALNQSLMELGATVCTPRSPKCGECPVRPHCDALAQNLVEQLPNIGARTVATQRRFAALVATHGDRVLVRQRPGDVVNARLWEFPNVELTNGDTVAPNSFAQFTPRLSPLASFCTIRHTITRYRITVEAFRADAESARAADGCVWIPRSELEHLPFTSAHAKIRSKLFESS